MCFFLGTNVEPPVRRAHEEELLRTYHAELLAAGVPEAAYAWEQCWADYRMQLWWPLFQVLTMAQGWAKQKKQRAGMWADKPSTADAKMREMYAKYHPRLVAALTDHKWNELLVEGDAACGVCSCCSFCA